MALQLIMLQPDDKYVDRNQEIDFCWYYGTSSEWPVSAKIRWMLEGSTETHDIDFPTTIYNGKYEKYTAPPETFPNGEIRWEVQVTSDKGELSTWRGAKMIVIGAESAPKLTSVGLGARPLITWQTDGQLSYQVTIYKRDEMLWDSGSVYSLTPSCRPVEYMENGTYWVKVRVQNASGEWSKWSSETEFIVNETPPAAPVLSAEKKSNAVQVSISGAGFAKYYIYRDGVRVYKLTAPGAWIDYTANGIHSYFIRGVTVGEAYADSGPVEVSCIVKDAILAPYDDLSKGIKLRLNRGNITVSESTAPQGDGRFYAGRNHPVYEFSEFTAQTASIQYSFKTRDEFKEIQALILCRNTMLYRNSFGDRFWCVVTGMEHSTDRYSRDFTLNLSFVDYVEEIPYDPVEVM